MQIEVKIQNLNEVKAALAKSPIIVSKHINKAIRESITLDLQRDITEETPRKTGELKRSILRGIRISNLRGEIGTNLNYALYVHRKTKPHIIVPKTKKALYWKGAAHPYRIVHHPGTKANPFMERGVRKAEPSINRRFQVGLRDALNEIANEAR